MTPARTTNNRFPSFPSLTDRFFEGDLMDMNSSGFAAENSTLPAVNGKENENEFQVEVAAPELKKSDFNLNYDNGRLIISSEKKSEHEEKDGDRITRREFSYQSFSRSFAIPENTVNADKIPARYENGILKAVLPKRGEGFYHFGKTGAPL